MCGQVLGGSSPLCQISRRSRLSAQQAQLRARIPQQPGATAYSSGKMATFFLPGKDQIRFTLVEFKSAISTANAGFNYNLSRRLPSIYMHIRKGRAHARYCGDGLSCHRLKRPSSDLHALHRAFKDHRGLVDLRLGQRTVALYCWRWRRTRAGHCCGPSDQKDEGCSNSNHHFLKILQRDARDCNPFTSSADQSHSYAGIQSSVHRCPRDGRWLRSPRKCEPRGRLPAVPPPP